MLKALRRSRLLAALLFAASPAIGGTVLPAVHPCPVDMPWLAPDAGTASHGDHHQGRPEPDAQHHETCNCIGSWNSGSAIAPPEPARVSATGLVVYSPVQIVAADSSLALSPPATLLPPATAPPLV
jgi:hypothetical protein